MLFFAIIIPSAFSLIWLTPYTTYGFDAPVLMWIYNSPEFMPSCDRITTLVTSVLATFCYLLVLLHVLKKSRSKGSEIHGTSRQRDTLLTLQVVNNSGYTVCVSIYFITDLRCIRAKFIENTRNQKILSLILDMTFCSQHRTSVTVMAIASCVPPKPVIPLKNGYAANKRYTGAHLKQTFGAKS
ncbi:unnamed protein product [Thelazia callipaeda]|uniref:7TM_GPCR_Srx domain-containing protein n=1 Tax=Thelazia callipaeda TaxID=103827 RepID=A0A0N5D2G0_THECL|nr:unnamed protein product [Thelazia callipaeda]